MRARLSRTTAYARDIAFRVKRRYTKRYSDLELRQLRALQRAYSGPRGPELLVFGDSIMIWSAPEDEDRGHMTHVIRDEVGGGARMHSVVGAGYSARIIIPFLTALRDSPSKPQVIIVPVSSPLASRTWQAHPILGYERVAASLQKVVDERDTKCRKLDRPLDYGGRNGQKAMPADPAWDAYDRMPAPSLIGIKRTVGELRLLVNATPQTRWQKLVRFRHMLDYHQAERLEPDTPGVELVGQMGALLRELGVLSVGYVAPINYELAGKLLGPTVPEHIARNVEVVSKAFRDAVGDTGALVNEAFAAKADDFSDMAHVNAAKRRSLAVEIAVAVKKLMANAEGSGGER